MLSINNPIEENDIYDAKQLAPGHPVFRLDGYGNDAGKIDSIVIKLESGQAPAVGFASAHMQLIDPRARSVLLTQTELAAVRAWCSHGGVGDVLMVPAAKFLRADLQRPGSWIKMENKQLVNLEDAANSRLGGDKADVRIIARALKAQGGLEGLGGIIAVDLFTGYNDRFVYNLQNPNEKVGRNDPTFGKLNSLQNVGNVFVEIGPNGVARPIGLDNFDPYSEFKSPHQAVDDSWPGLLLIESDNVKRHFAERVIEDLEHLLGPRSRKVKFLNSDRLGKRRKDRLVDGIDTAAARLRHLVRQYANATPNPPAGVTSRLAALHW